MATAGSLAAACAANLHTIPIDKLLMGHSIRQAMNKPLTRRRRAPNDRVGQYDYSKMPLSSSEKRSRINIAENGETCERVRATVRVRPPTILEEQRDEDGARFIFLDTVKNTVILRRKNVSIAHGNRYAHNRYTTKIVICRGSFVDFTQNFISMLFFRLVLRKLMFTTVQRGMLFWMCCKGYNGTIMAYGQTGAGKTYTLSDKLCTGGTTAEGIIPRSAAEIFAAAEQDSTHDYHMSVLHSNLHGTGLASIQKALSEVISHVLLLVALRNSFL